MKYYRVIQYGGNVPVRVSAGVEHGNGEMGILDPRFVNEYGCYRRISGKAVSSILKLANKKWIRGVCGGIGRVDYNAYEVPLMCIETIDIYNDCDVIQAENEIESD